MIDPFATHQRMLVKYLMGTEGTILELGCGNYSTPIIHEIGTSQKRHIITVDNDIEWIELFDRFRTENHKCIHVVEWDEWKPEGVYGLAFIDHAPGGRRVIEMQRLLTCVDLFVVHDTEDPSYGFDSIASCFRHVETDDSETPWTSVYRPIEALGPS